MPRHWSGSSLRLSAAVFRCRSFLLFFSAVSHRFGLGIEPSCSDAEYDLIPVPSLISWSVFGIPNVCAGCCGCRLGHEPPILGMAAAESLFGTHAGTFRAILYVSVWVLIWGTAASLVDLVLLERDVYGPGSFGQLFTFASYGVAAVVLATRFAARFLKHMD